MENNLKKDIGLFAAISTVMGTVIGGGIFFKTSAVTQATHGVGLSLLVWFIGGILTICAGLSVSELAAAMPKTGGPIEIIGHTYGSIWGFLLGWAQMLVYFPANIAALSIVFATQIINLFHLSSGYLILIALLCSGSVTALNFLGAKVGGQVQSITLVIKLIPIFIIAIAGLLIPGKVSISLIPLVSSHAHVNLITAFSGGLLATLFAYDGWLGVCNIAGEMKNPKRDLPLAIILGLTFIMIIYILINVAFLKTLPLDQLAGNQNAASDAAIKMFGQLGGKLVTVGILISVYGAINGYTLTGMRVPFTLANNNSLPFSKLFTKISTNTSVPYVAGIFEFIISTIMVIMGNFDMLTNMLVFVMWIFNTLLFIAVFKLRRVEPELERPYKVPGYPIVPLIAILGGVFILSTTIITQLGLAIVGLIITAIGIPIYYIHKWYIKKASN
ncbi:APC family permease [Lentilactobacillus laojiaonis]|uniref:APC family permease n=1 Tax=Lentilactobacillus laojiaonis TaxID=2883998 RepID=UPI001D0B5C54|nr:amino acid permease [Lentilactobacillus laojiaonis]UDM32418.1 amino acid permease [Lentilactobacillus laojiaonis]